MSGDWVTYLAAELRAAIDSPGETLITVPTRARKAIAQQALDRMSPGCTRVRIEVAGEARCTCDWPPGNPALVHRSWCPARYGSTP